MRSMQSSSKTTWSASTSAADRGKVIASSGRGVQAPLGGTYRATRLMTGTAQPPRAIRDRSLQTTPKPARKSSNQAPPTRPQPRVAGKYTSSGWGEAPLG